MAFPLLTLIYDTQMPGGDALEIDVRRALMSRMGGFKLSPGWKLLQAGAPFSVDTARVVYLRRPEVTNEEATAALAAIQSMSH
ncbi:MAG: hypothetical protein EOP21_03195 [Hyphomicrobiales bacterium]|nr:MAG: hypothetical protein EOP21_03195 [Hyphomicrobiales bacterium]